MYSDRGHNHVTIWRKTQRAENGIFNQTGVEFSSHREEMQQDDLSRLRQSLIHRADQENDSSKA